MDEVDAGIAQGQFDLIEGETYDFSFDAFSGSFRSIEIRVFLEVDTYSDYFIETIDLKYIVQGYSLSFDMNEIST